MADKVFQFSSGNDVTQINGDVTILVTVIALKKIDSNLYR